MSGIFGLFHLDNSPVDPEDMQKMMKGMAHWGPDGRSQIISGPIGLGQLLLHNTPEARLEKLPRQTASGLLLTAEARLDNRPGLFRQLNIPPPEQTAITDSQLIELAYEKWGEACPDYLLGDWSFAIWNPQTQTIFAARDHYGSTAFYYFQDARRFAFASSRDALLALGVPRRLNELYLAQVLISWPAYHKSSTIDMDITRLPAAHALRLCGQKLEIWPYWRLEDTPILQLPTFADYVASFQEIYQEAVDCRLRSNKPVGVTLSGGLDSGSVTALAAQTLHSQNKRLAAYTAVPLYDVQNTVETNRFGDETEFAQATATFYPNVDHHLLTSEKTSPLAGLQRILSLRNEPGHAGSNFFWIADILQTVQNEGIGTMLTGQNGNATVSWIGTPFLHSFWKMWKIRGWRTAVKHHLPTFAQRQLRLHRLKRDNWRHSAIHPNFANKLKLAQQQADSIGKSLDLAESIKTSRQLRLAILQPGTSLAGAIWAELGAGFRLDVRDPTTDKRIMEYTFSIPDHFFIGPNGEDRWLLRTAMAKQLPDQVRLSSKRGKQAADLVHRLQDSKQEIELLLPQLAHSKAAEFIDMAKIQTAWEAIREEPTIQTTKTAVTILMRGLNAGLFLLAQ